MLKYGFMFAVGGGLVLDFLESIYYYITPVFLKVLSFCILGIHFCNKISNMCNISKYPTRGTTKNTAYYTTILYK